VRLKRKLVLLLLASLMLAQILVLQFSKPTKASPGWWKREPRDGTVGAQHEA